MVSDGQIPEGRDAGAAGQGVASDTGAAGGAGVTGTAEGTAQQATRPEAVSLEDFKRFQASMSRQADSLRRTLDAERQQAAQVLQQLQEHIDQRDQEIIRLKTDGLPTEQVEYEKGKLERERLARQNEALKRQAAQIGQTLNQVVTQTQEQQAREQVIRMFMDGAPGQHPSYKQYGLTRQDLEKCQTPYEMEDVARQKAASWLEAQKAEVEKQRATVTAKDKKATGQAKFDQGEPTTGAVTIPKPGTPEFKQFYQDVLARRIKLH